MGSLSTDPDGYGPKDIVDRLRRCIETGVYGIDYTILARDKNEELIDKYIISEADRIDILRGLSIDNYDGWDYSNNNDFSKDIIHKFHQVVSLLPRGIEDAVACDFKLYIKLTWTKSGEILIIISFHD